MGKIKLLIPVLLILIIASFSFFPAIKNDFTNWDETYYVIDNPLIKNLSLPGIIKMFTAPHYAFYKPTVMLSFALEYHFFKLNPFAYHTTNFILHLINCLLVFIFVYIFSKDVMVAFIVGLLFGIHPLHVESVAWVAERKDMLYALFILGAYIFYLKHVQSNKIVYFYFSLLSFILSLLAKPMGVLFPFIILLFDYCLGVRHRKSDWVRRVSFFLVSILFCIFTFHSARNYMIYQQPLGYLKNIVFASYGIVFYIYKFFAPINLSCFYPYPQGTFSSLAPIVLFSPVLVIILILVTIISCRYNKKIIFGAGFFCLNILPALQIVRTAPHMVADRYIYIALIGLSYLAAVAIKSAYLKLRRLVAKSVFYMFFIFIIVLLSFATRQRCGVWKNSFTLWEDAIKHTSGNAFAYNNLGAAYSNINKNEEAISKYKKAIEISPTWWVPHKNMCGSYVAIAKYKEAIEECRIAIKFGPPANVLLPGEDRLIHLSTVYHNLGVAHDKLGNKEEAIKAYERAVEIDPEDIEASNDLAALYTEARRIDQAIDLWEKIVRINPNFATAHFNLAVFYFQQKKYDLAIRHCDKVTELGGTVDPKFIKLLEPHRE